MRGIFRGTSQLERSILEVDAFLSRASATPNESRPRVFHGPVHAQIARMFRAVRLFRRWTPVFSEPRDPRDVAGVAFGHPKGEQTKGVSRAPSRPGRGEVSERLALCPRWARVFSEPRDPGDVAGAALGHPKGDPTKGVSLARWRPDWGGCLERLACFRSWMRVFSDPRDLRDEAGVARTPRGSRLRLFDGPVRAQIVGMS